VGAIKKKDSNGRDKKGRFVKGAYKGGPGRPAGSGGRQQLANMILQAVDDKGGIKWLKKLEDREFVSLVKPLVPRNLELSGPNGGPVELEVLLRQAKKRAADARDSDV
jgi:hypothetical protein